MPTSPGEWLREVDFWRTLPVEYKELYVEVTSTMPMDRRAGLVDIHSTLWRKHKTEKIALTMVLLVKTVLNCWTTFYNRPVYIFDAFSVAGGLEREVPFFNNSGGTLTLISHAHAWNSTAVSDSSLKLCLHGEDWSIQGSSTAGELKCTTRKDVWLLTLYSMVSIFEQVAVSGLGLSILVGFFLFVVCAYDAVLMRFPFVFFRALNIVSTYSVLHLIHFANPVIAKRLPHEMISFWMFLGWKDVPGSENQLRTSVAALSAGLLILFGLALSICGLIMNVYMLSFVVLVVPWKWALSDLLHLVAFVNRMANLVNLDHMEIDRLLLFRYGGSESKWKKGQEGQRQSKAAKGFFDLVALKLVSGKFVRSREERLHGFMCLATFRSEDLQRLWLDPDHEKSRDDAILRTKEEMQRADALLNPWWYRPSWPPRGSDPNHQRKHCEGLHPLEQLVKDNPEVDHRLSYFLENMQSYRLWLESGKLGEVLLYDASGKLIPSGGQQSANGESRTPAQDAVAPRIEQLEQMAADLMLDCHGTMGRSSMEAFDQATVIHMEVEDLKLIGTRSQSLASAEHKKHDALAFKKKDSSDSRSGSGLSALAANSQQTTTGYPTSLVGGSRSPDAAGSFSAGSVELLPLKEGP